MDGDTLIVEVTHRGESLTLKSHIRYPKTGKAPYPVLIGTSMISLPRPLLEDMPIATMTFHEKQVNDYGQWGKHHERGEHDFDRLYPELKDNGAYSEWAWGLSRLIDGLQLLGEEVTRIDTRHILHAGMPLRIRNQIDSRFIIGRNLVQARPVVARSDGNQAERHFRRRDFIL